MRKTILFVSLLTLVGVLAAACGSGSGSNNAATNKPSGNVIAGGPAGNNLTATLTNSDGVLHKGKQEFTLTFADASGKPVDVGSVALNYRMPTMGGMAEMNSGTTFTTTGTPGVYLGKAEIDMAGEWQAQITYEGAAGKGQASFSVKAK